MCLSLNAALCDNVITHNEHEKAKKEINKYLGGYSTLSIALMENEYPNFFNDTLHIYENWDSKPTLF